MLHTTLKPRNLITIFATLLSCYFIYFAIVFFQFESFQISDTAANINSFSVFFTPSSQEPKLQCQNTVQGIDILADDQGYLCRREELQDNGCCPVGPGRYSCTNCLVVTTRKENKEVATCCMEFELCVSCCLSPVRFNYKADTVEYLNVDSEFEVCLATCRTSSSSLNGDQHYLFPQRKYCFYSKVVQQFPIFE